MRSYSIPLAPAASTTLPQRTTSLFMKAPSFLGSAGQCTQPKLVEAILGFRLRGTQLELNPCIPRGWSGYEIMYRHRSSTYHVVVEHSAGFGRDVRRVSVDGRPVPDHVVELADDGRQHEVRVALAVT